MEEKILDELKKANESLRRIADSSDREKREKAVEEDCKRLGQEFAKELAVLTGIFAKRMASVVKGGAK